MHLNEAHNCVVVLGPTASGKTTLACELALRLGGEIISADSRQVYKGLDIGTGKDLAAYTVGGQSIPYHLIDIAEPGTQFYLHDFIAGLGKVFREVAQRDHVPIICGGTGLYLDALRKDYSFTQVPENEKLQMELKEEKKENLLSRLSKLPPEFVTKVDKTSVKRLIRGIVVGEYLKSNRISPANDPPFRPVYIGIYQGKGVLEKRILQRLELRLEKGMVEETKGLLEKGVDHERLQRLGLEYKFISSHIRGELTLEEMKRGLFTAIRQFAKRQMTWFRKMEREGIRITWLTEPKVTAELLDAVRDSLKTQEKI